MRELKDYFCAYEQTQELIKLGLKNYKSLMCWNKEHGVLKLGNMNVWTISRAPLRSQALDFFRDLGYWITPKLNNEHYYFEISKINRSGYAYSYKDLDYPKSESFLISKLIELEKEARNGN